LSKQTADILVASGKESWVIPREEKIFAKGKGQLQTFWLRMGADFSASSETKSTTSSSSGAAHKKLQKVGRTETYKKSQKPLTELEAEHAEKRMERLVQWQVEGLSNSLRQIIARRASSTSRTPSLTKEKLRKLPTLLDKHELLKEVKEVLSLPQFDAKTFHNNVDPSSIQLPQNVIQQLTALVTKIATSYNNENPFHNFVSMRW
jgi:hypothetical protein